MAENDKVVVTKSKLDALASALRTIFGFTGKKTIEQLTEEAWHYDPRPDIADATATAAQILKPYTAYVNGGKVTGEIESLAATAYAPSTRPQTIPAGKYLAGAQTIQAMKLQTKVVTSPDTIVKPDNGYDGLGNVVVKAGRYPLRVWEDVTGDAVSAENGTLTLSEAATTELSGKQIFMIVAQATTTPSEATGVLMALDCASMSAFISMASSGFRLYSSQFITHSVNSAGRSVLTLRQVGSAKLTEETYRVMIFTS